MTADDRLDIIEALLLESFRRPYLVTYGHSFLAETGLPNADHYWARKLATFLGSMYPTNGSSGDLKRAVGGSYAESAADVMLAGEPWISDKRHGSNKVLVIQALINTARKNGADEVTRRGAEHALRTMCALGSSLETIPDSAPFFTYSGGWAGGSDSAFHGGSYRVTTTNGSYVEFTVPAFGSHFLTVARKDSLTGSVISFQRLDTGQTFKTWNNVNQAQAGISRPYVVAAIPLQVPAGTKVRVSLESGTNLVCDGLIVPAERPGPIVLMKEPHLADYSTSAMFPNGSDAALNYFNTILDSMSTEFPNVVVADPNTAGYWDKNTHVLPDGVHPNTAGHDALFMTGVDAVRHGLWYRTFQSGLAL